MSIRYEILKSDFSPLLYGTYLLGFLLDEDIKVESNYPGAELSRTIDHGFLKIGFAGGVDLSYKNRLLLKTGLFCQIGLDGVNVVTKIQGVEFNIAFFINKR